MKSKHPKVLHSVCGKPMVQHVVDELGLISARAADVHAATGSPADTDVPSGSVTAV
jgi:bifunctional N-acetylglucosamine-1-phosphate-uridyltransferase/glucosamine-1-phosphate-acetyltransferase GlmU-like protein